MVNFEQTCGKSTAVRTARARDIKESLAREASDLKQQVEKFSVFMSHDIELRLSRQRDIAGIVHVVGEMTQKLNNFALSMETLCTVELLESRQQMQHLSNSQRILDLHCTAELLNVRALVEQIMQEDGSHESPRPVAEGMLVEAAPDRRAHSSPQLPTTDIEVDDGPSRIQHGIPSAANTDAPKLQSEPTAELRAQMVHRKSTPPTISKRLSPENDQVDIVATTSEMELLLALDEAMIVDENDGDGNIESFEMSVRDRARLFTSIFKPRQFDGGERPPS